MATTSLDLMGTFANNFNLDDIYEAGWYAAQAWMGVISGTLVALAIGIRSLEEKINLITTGKSNYLAMFTNVIIIAVCIGLYFGLAHLVIQLLNAIYGSLNHADSVRTMTSQLDDIRTGILEKDYEFAMGDIADSLYTVVATFAYAITFCVLVALMLFCRIAHAILVTFCLFWGAVALPMSITTGLKMLKGWKIMCLTAAIWPVVESFFLYLVTTALSNMLESSNLGVEDVETWNMGTLLFYLGVFSIINLLLISFIVSAPLIATAVANGSGGIAGMVGSFAGAAIGAGVMAGSSMANKFNAGGKGAWNRTQGLLGTAGQKLGLGGNKSTPPQGNGSGPSGGIGRSGEGWGVGYGDAKLTFGDASGPAESIPTGSIGDAHNYNHSDGKAGGTNGGAKSQPSSGNPISSAKKPIPQTTTSGSQFDASQSEPEASGDEKPTSLQSMDDAKEKRAKQDRRGAIINQNKRKPII